jgi:hypothetical protein
MAERKGLGGGDWGISVLVVDVTSLTTESVWASGLIAGDGGQWGR